MLLLLRLLLLLVLMLYLRLVRILAAIAAEKVFILLALLITQIHALRVEPFAAEVAVDVHEVGVQWLLADAEFVPRAKRRVQSLGQRAVGRPREVRRLNVNRFKLVILLDLVDLALAHDGVSEDFIAVPRREHFILPDILDVVVRHIELLHVQVLLAVVPLDLNHRLAGLLLAPALLDDPDNAADNRALLRLAEEGKLADAVYHAPEHELTVDRRGGPRSHGGSLCLCVVI